ncbi:MAG TPA: NrfD/PsrC family molybdoenzyme membrane anchor subunit [Solirubrobacterales bacterium]|jgi:formate-dependent nitrite reductase membrane component NrfD
MTQEARSEAGRGQGRRGGETAMVPREEPLTYYDRPVVKPPVWKPEVPLYFFCGGLAGASAVLAAGAGFAGRHTLARRSWAVALAGVSASPPLLIADLGKPSRFMYMLRVFKITSPMSVGAWLLAANGGAITLAAGLHRLQPQRRGGAPELLAAALGAPLSSYTAVLICNSAIPAWSEARRQMPFVFVSSAAASAAGAAAIAVPPTEAAPARRLAVAAAVVEVATTLVMHKRLGYLADSYKRGTAGRFGGAARALTAGGAVALALGGRRRDVAAAGGAMLLAGSICKRLSVFRAGAASALDPSQTVRTQRERMARRKGGA